MAPKSKDSKAARAVGLLPCKEISVYSRRPRLAESAVSHPKEQLPGKISHQQRLWRH